MTLDEIITRLEAFVEQEKEEVDKEAMDWAKCMAKYEHNSDLKKAKFAAARQRYSGTVAEVDAQAQTDPAYREFIDGIKLSEDELYFLNRYKHEHGMERIGVLRSLLAFHRGRISQDI